MKKILGFIAAVAVLMISVPAFGETEIPDEQCLRWRFPGGDVNERTLEETIAALEPESGVERAHLTEKFSRSVVTIDQVREKLAGSSYGAAERARILTSFQRTKKKFWSAEKVEEMPIPAEFKQSLLTLVEPTNYRAVTIRRGYKIPDTFLFARNAKRSCAIFDPAPGQPQEILLHIFDVATADGGTKEYVHSTICSNVGKGEKKDPKVTTKEIKPPPPAKIETAEPSGWKSLTAHAWLHNDHANRFQQQDGFNSRDLGSGTAGTKSTKNHHMAGCDGSSTVVFEFLGVNYAAARGKKFRMDGVIGVIPDNFGPEPRNRSFRVPVCNGTANIAVGAEDWDQWITETSVIRVHAEGAMAKKLHYPRVAVLTTCSGEGGDETKCGKRWTTRPGELYLNLSRQPNTRFSFVVLN